MYICVMRIISEQTIRDFALNHKNDSHFFKSFIKELRSFKGTTAKELKVNFPDIDHVGNKRYVFNIKRNEYRVVGLALFGQGIIFIRFIGKHADYDKIKNIKNI